MKYVSTRGRAAPVDFVTACLAGLAPDGGLYVPDAWPQIEPAHASESYVSLATRILSAFAGDVLPASAVQDICTAAYASFAHQSVTPLVQTGSNQWMLELHHGPTLAFKDVAMQFIGRFYDHALKAQERRLTVICATSGDTGGAAAAAFAGSDVVDLFILHPHERVSPVQRRFMTCTGAANVHNLALDGDFDDCQAIVKALFADQAFAGEVSLSGVNSINWARIAAQSVYYAYVQAALGPGRPLRFVVPSGNMGDALAGYVAAKCGLLADLDLVCAVNENQVLADLLQSGGMKRQPAVQTPSPAMDITVPSNFERLLYELTGRDADAVRAAYDAYAQSHELRLPEAARTAIGSLSVSAKAVGNNGTLDEMRRTLSETGLAICPHTAVGMAAMRDTAEPDRPSVLLATAHAAKFPETVKEATGLDAPLPARCAQVADGAEVFERLDADVQAVRAHISRLVS